MKLQDGINNGQSVIGFVWGSRDAYLTGPNFPVSWLEIKQSSVAMKKMIYLCKCDWFWIRSLLSGGETSIKTRWRISCQKSVFLFVSSLSSFPLTLHHSPSLSFSFAVSVSFYFIIFTLTMPFSFFPCFPPPFHSASVFLRILSTLFCFRLQRSCMLICWRRRARCVGFNHPEGWLGGFWKLVCWD